VDQQCFSQKVNTKCEDTDPLRGAPYIGNAEKVEKPKKRNEQKQQRGKAKKRYPRSPARN